MEQIAEKIELWANDKKRHRMLRNGLAGLGCRSSLSKPLRGFGTILLKLKCWRPEAAQELEKAHIRLLSSAKEIDQQIKDGHRGFVFSASAVQVSANLLAKKLRTIAEMAKENVSSERHKDGMIQPELPTRRVPLTKAAKWFDCDYRTLKKDIKSGKIKARRFSDRRWEFDLDQVTEFKPSVRADADPTEYSNTS